MSLNIEILGFMSELRLLSFAFQQFADLSEEEFNLSSDFWEEKTYNKGEYFNEYQNVCKYLGFIIDGVFRSYVIDEKSGEEKNVFFYSPNQFAVSFKSFVNQVPCDYHTKAVTDSKVIRIHIDHLQKLYRESHGWERFGRLLAQQAFNVVIERTEDFLFKSPEQRYLDLMKDHPNIFNSIPLYHISSYLGIQGPSLSRIRKRISGK